MLIDTHSHIYAEEFDADRDSAVARAKDSNVVQLLMPDIDSSTRGRMMDVAEKYEGYALPMIGLHPTSITSDNLQNELKEVERLLANHKFYGIGECGLDFYWDSTWKKEQIYAFEYQLGLSSETKLPIVIHTRKALEEVFASLKKFHDVQGILHCFPGNVEDAERAIDMGMLLGIGGVVTYDKSKMSKVVAKFGVKNVVLETDCPYLTPVPHKGERNESSFIKFTSSKIAELCHISEDVVENITSSNAINLFNLNLKTIQ